MNIRGISSNCGSIYRYLEKRMEDHLHMLNLTGKPLKGLQSFSRMLRAKGKRCISNSRDNFGITGKIL